jgi:hypothetical protein
MTKDDLTVLSLAAGVARQIEEILQEYARLEREHKPIPQSLIDRGFHAIRAFQRTNHVITRRFGDGV